MRKNLFLAIIAIFGMACALNAQNTGLRANINNTHVKPVTAITVTVKVKKEVVEAGPFARYSQEMLGVIAPLNNKTIYSIESIKLNTTHSGDIELNGKTYNSKSPIKAMQGNKIYGSRTIKNKDLGISPIHGSDGARKSLKTAAKETADVIYKIRKRRVDLISGDVSDMVYGEGMKDALKEMKRIERQYTNLFLGTQSCDYETYQFEIVPNEKSKFNVLFRFDTNDGVLETNNIAGVPVVIYFTKENLVVKGEESKAYKKGDVKGSEYMVPDVVHCKVMLENRVLAEKRVNIFQFGEKGVTGSSKL